jgi:hypothetical protein
MLRAAPAAPPRRRANSRSIDVLRSRARAGPAEVEAVLAKLIHTTSVEDVNVGASPTLADGVCGHVSPIIISICLPVFLYACVREARACVGCMNSVCSQVYLYGAACWRQ